MEEVSIVKAHQVKGDGTLAVVIPEHVREELELGKGARLIVYRDSKGRIVM